MRANQLKSRDQIKQEMERKGISYTELARRVGQDRQAVYLVLNTNTPCRFGKSHNAAVALGIKAGELTNG